jgi:hypothetical protein
VSIYFKLKRQYRLYQIYPEIEHCLPVFLRLYSTLKKKGMRPDNLEWFVNAMETGTIKLRASKPIPKPSKQGSDRSLPTAKVGKRFAGHPKTNSRTN